MIQLIERTFVADVTVDTAWKHLAKIDQWHTWATHINHINHEPTGELGINSRGTIHLRNGIKSTFAMTEFNPKTNWTWVGPFLWLTVHYDHRFQSLPDNQCEMTFVVAVDGVLASVFGRLFAVIYNRNLDVAIPNLQKELASIQ